MTIEVVSPIEVEAEVQRYTLVSDDIYVRRYDVTTIPLWYRNLIEGLVASDPTITDINGAINYLSSLDAGYTIKFANLDTVDTSLNSTLTSLVSTTGGHTAAIASLDSTKVDATSASAIALSTVGTYFANGTAGAWFNSQISSYASAISANAMNLSTLSATLNGHTVMIEDISTVSIDPITGYKLGASKIGTAPDGSITGWQFADGTGIQSSFKIMATNFSVSDGTTGYVPFSISGTNVKFNGVVDFTNTNAYGTTTIDGGKITTGSITAGQIAANTITASNIVVGTITADRLNISTLSAISANLGTITAGVIITNGLRWANSAYPTYTGLMFISTSRNPTGSGYGYVSLIGYSVPSGFNKYRTLLASQVVSVTISASILIPSNFPSGWMLRLVTDGVQIDSPVYPNTTITASMSNEITINGSISHTIYAYVVTNTGAAVSSTYYLSSIAVTTVNVE